MLAPILDEMGLNPLEYNKPIDLSRRLGGLINWEQKTIIINGEIHPLEWYDPILDFLKWIWEQIANFVSPWTVDIGLIIIGCMVTYLATGYYKSLGAIPIGVAIWDVLKKAGVI